MHLLGKQASVMSRRQGSTPWLSAINLAQEKRPPRGRREGGLKSEPAEG
jgi:hypothetical protein